MPLTSASTEISPTIYRKDYVPPAFAMTNVHLEFDLEPAHTRVTNRMQLVRQRSTASDTPLVLHGQEQEIVSVAVNGVPMLDFRHDAESLTLLHVPEAFELTLVTTCNPQANTSLMGLCISNGNFFTQCEAEGFRKITYFLDRPDVMSAYTVTLRASQADFPVLLANGNLIAEGRLPDGRHFATWQDPFLKPSYLFAIVAGKLVKREAHTISGGKEKLLQVWVAPKDLDKTQHALDSLIAAIHWDERRFGRALDLERFMIVAVGDFNMGAMENKGLNIFNTKFVLANPDTATDLDYANIEAVVGHEYFHNWTGNRVTCRDWFQLSLKEGLTVFRDQEFSADMMGSATGRAVKRIEDVRLLRQAQFPEDAGPMAHSVRPDSYQEISNFYTVTIYEKGAEVVRMLQTLLGVEGFRKGMDLYFARHDGQAVTCDDFRAAMADANGRDLTQFERWYSQAGTPRVAASAYYDANARTYTLTLRQACPATPKQASKLPFHIPFAVGLLAPDGSEYPLQLAGEAIAHAQTHPTSRVLELTDSDRSFTFLGISQPPVPSLLRDFSAPVVLEYAYTDAELLHLLAFDTDPFNRWEAGQRLAVNRLLALVAAVQAQQALVLDEAFIQAWRGLLNDTALDPAFKELALTLPSEVYLAEQMAVVDPQAIHTAREWLRATLAKALQAEWAHIYATHQTSGDYSPDGLSAGKRALKNLALAMLQETGNADWQRQAFAQFEAANNMTDRMAALSALVHSGAAQSDSALAAFYTRYAHEALVLDKWFALQAGRKPESLATGTVLDGVRTLLQHPDFALSNPNRARSVVHTYCMANPAGFHRTDGAAYVFWAEQVIALDAINPQVAARLARALDHWRKFAPPYQAAMRSALEQVLAQREKLSKDTFEIVSKALA